MFFKQLTELTYYIEFFPDFNPINQFYKNQTFQNKKNFKYFL